MTTDQLTDKPINIDRKEVLKVFRAMNKDFARLMSHQKPYESRHYKWMLASFERCFLETLDQLNDKKD